MGEVNMERDIKLRVIKDFLTKYTDPIPALTGISAHSLAEKLLVSMEEAVFNHEIEGMLKAQECDRETHAYEAYE